MIGCADCRWPSYVRRQSYGSPAAVAYVSEGLELTCPSCGTKRWAAHAGAVGTPRRHALVITPARLTDRPSTPESCRCGADRHMRMSEDFAGR
jgi:hypothetical protein